jgi:hypothetical protein
MDAVALIEQAKELGLDLTVVDGFLKVKGPRNASSFISLLRRHRDDVIGVLSAATPSAAPPPRVDCSAGTHSSADTRTRSLFTENENRVSAGPGEKTGNEGGSEPFDSIEVEADLRSLARPNTCGSLHIQPERWERRGERALCPGCGKFMGVVKNQPDQDGHLPSSNR